MKNLKNLFLLAVVTVVTVFIYSCAKEESVVNKNDIINNRDGGVKVYQACWSEWGRASKDCESWGLCNYTDCWVWQDDYPCCNSTATGGSGDIIYDGLGNGQLIIKLNSIFPGEADAILNHKSLVVDSDITNLTVVQGYNKMTVKSGNYLFNTNIGLQGGYAVDLEFSN